MQNHNDGISYQTNFEAEDIYRELGNLLKPHSK